MISVIIPSTTGGFLHLTKLMPGLSEEPDKEIIVIDNYSKDGTCNYLSNHDCLIKVNTERKNFSQSNNQGAKLAKGEHLLFLNNDTYIQKGLLQEMANTFNVDPKIGVVGCLIYTMVNPKKIQHAGINFTSDYLPYELGKAMPFLKDSRDLTNSDPRVLGVREVPSVTAACMMVKKEVFEEVGGFDEEYQTGWEDTDLVLRIREKGYKVWYTGKTHIYHLHFGSKAAGRFNYEVENRKRYDTIWVDTGRARKVLGDFREA